MKLNEHDIYILKEVKDILVKYDRDYNEGWSIDYIISDYLKIVKKLNDERTKEN